MSDFGDYRHPKAQKDYRCEWCGQAIPKGDIHYQFAGRWECEWQAWRMHMECQESGWAEGDISDGFTPFENERPAKLVVH